jgi:pimeloyl-ACP methyl ester carboxylesterase
MQVVVDGLLTNYSKSGQGKAVVCLHGWGTSADTFVGLQKSLPNYTFLAPDLPGFGGSEPPLETWGLENYAKFVANWLQKINQDEIYAVIGHSNGGAVAIKAISDGLIKPQKLVLLASAGIRGRQKVRKTLLKVVAKTGKVAMAPLPKTTKRKLRAKFYKKIGSDLLIVEGMEETFKKTVAEDVRNVASKLQLPTLLVYGESDEETPARYGEIFQRTINNSRLIKLPKIGHFLLKEKPEEVSKLIKDFLAGNDV